MQKTALDPLTAGTLGVMLPAALLRALGSAGLAGAATRGAGWRAPVVAATDVAVNRAAEGVGDLAMATAGLNWAIRKAMTHEPNPPEPSLEEIEEAKEMVGEAFLDEIGKHAGAMKAMCAAAAKKRPGGINKKAWIEHTAGFLGKALSKAVSAPAANSLADVARPLLQPGAQITAPKALSVATTVERNPKLKQEALDLFGRFKGDPSLRAKYPKLDALARDVPDDPTSLGTLARGRLAARVVGDRGLVDEGKAFAREALGIEHLGAAFADELKKLSWGKIPLPGAGGGALRKVGPSLGEIGEIIKKRLAEQGEQMGLERPSEVLRRGVEAVSARPGARVDPSIRAGQHPLQRGVPHGAGRPAAPSTGTDPTLDLPWLDDLESLPSAVNQAKWVRMQKVGWAGFTGELASLLSWVPDLAGRRNYEAIMGKTAAVYTHEDLSRRGARLSKDATVKVGPPPERNRKEYPYTGTIQFQDLPEILVENRKGSTRSGVDPDGKAWAVTMPAHYGEFRRTNGSDGDPVDVYVGDDAGSSTAYIVHTMRPPAFKSYDEDKVFIGFPDLASVKATMGKAYNDKRFLGGVSSCSVADLKKMLKKRSTRGKKLDQEQILKSAGRLVFAANDGFTAGAARALWSGFDEEMGRLDVPVQAPAVAFGS